jgi:hypothetical protein
MRLWRGTVVIAALAGWHCSYHALRLSGADPAGDGTTPPGDGATTSGDVPGGEPADPGRGDPGRGDPGRGDLGPSDVGHADGADGGGADDRGDRDGGDEPAADEGPAGWYALGGSELAPHGDLLAATVGGPECYLNTTEETVTGAVSGGISDTTGCSESPGAAIDAAGNPIAVWHENAATGWEIYLRRFDGSLWTELDGSASGRGLSTLPAVSATSGFPVVALDPGGDRMVVAWHDDQSGRFEIYLKEHVTLGWSSLGASADATVGGINANNRSSQGPVVALDPASGAVFVAWVDNESPSARQILLRWYNPATETWEELGGSATLGVLTPAANDNKNPAIALDDNGRPIVAWAGQVSAGTRQIQLKCWTGADWVELAGSASVDGVSASTLGAQKPSIAFGGAGLLVAWEDGALGTGNTEIELRAWNGTGWIAMAGSYGGPGISGTAEPSDQVSLAQDGDGRPVVAWREGSRNAGEIFLRRFDGTTWVEVEGSATGGGISTSPAGSYDPRLVIAHGRACVIWTEPGNTSLEIVMRCHRTW